MIKIMAATNSNEFVEFGITKLDTGPAERLFGRWGKTRGPLLLWSFPQWLKDNGFKTNHDFDGRGKLCGKDNY